MERSDKNRDAHIEKMEQEGKRCGVDGMDLN
jgi:hypothetical protein